MVKTIKRKINQLPTVTVYQSRMYQSRIGSKHTRQCSLSSRYNSVRREVECAISSAEEACEVIAGLDKGFRQLW